MTKKRMKHLKAKATKEMRTTLASKSIGQQQTEPTKAILTEEQNCSQELKPNKQREPQEEATPIRTTEEKSQPQKGGGKKITPIKERSHMPTLNTAKKPEKADKQKPPRRDPPDKGKQEARVGSPSS